ncbi:hypothetical protein VAWG006_16130 [Aeromonas enteropelogenes]|nr:hypothetical protein VAWG006_16130 [Aeromonas enteropelogenes]BEE21524.1 hypothetical protein VAWG007_16190 [Aeromonas enteropelogenes]
MDAMALVTHIMLDTSLLQPTHYHFRAGDIHYFHDKIGIEGRSLNQFASNQKRTRPIGAGPASFWQVLCIYSAQSTATLAPQGAL